MLNIFLVLIIVNIVYVLCILCVLYMVTFLHITYLYILLFPVVASKFTSYGITVIKSNLI